jgi:ATPase (PilT family)
LELKVNVPSGMVEQDLARPVIEISDFETNNLEYEIYTFGEENIIIPVDENGSQKTGIEHLAEERILEHLYRFDPHPKIEFQGPGRIKVFVSSDSIPSLIGKSGKNIQELEKTIGLHIDVEEHGVQRELPSMALPYDFSESRTAFIFEVDREFTGNIANFAVNDEFLFSSKIGKRGKIKVLKRSSEGKRFSRFVSTADSLEIFLKRD